MSKNENWLLYLIKHLELQSSNFLRNLYILFCLDSVERRLKIGTDKI